MSGSEVPEAPAPRPPASRGLEPLPYEKALALGALVLLALTIVSLTRGFGGWDRLDAVVWAHLASVLTPLALTPVLMLRTRGSRLHRVLGWTWAVTLFLTALISFGIRETNNGALSFIHVFSIITVISVPMLVWMARRHMVPHHRRIARGPTSGALLVAGYFTLLPGRILSIWLWG